MEDVFALLIWQIDKIQGVTIPRIESKRKPPVSERNPIVNGAHLLTDGFY